MDFSTFGSCFLLIFITGLLFGSRSVSSIGINYGQIANNLPSPDDVVPLVRSMGATKIKLYDADPRVLRAFANTGVEIMVGLGNEYLSKMQDSKQALNWIKSNLQPYLPATNITSIFVGNEILTFNDTSLNSALLPAMQGVHAALQTLGLDKQVTVTTTHSLAVLQTSFPPSSGAFRPDLTPCLTPILSFQAKTGSPFLINAYPYFAYKGNPKQVSLDFVLFQPNQGILDPSTNLHYDNMLFAQIDAVYSALASLGYAKLAVHISETGWPSKGDQDEAGATAENAKKYNGNLIKLVSQGMKKGLGTPMRPNSDLNIYVFALFNENMKPGPTSERNYGLFKPDGTPAYSIALSSPSSSSVGNSSGGTTISSGTPPLPPTSSTGYLSISSATSLMPFPWGFFILSGAVAVGAGDFEDFFIAESKEDNMALERRVKAEREKSKGSIHCLYDIAYRRLRKESYLSWTSGPLPCQFMYYISQLDIDFIAILMRYSFIMHYAQICVIHFSNATPKAHNKVLCPIYHIQNLIHIYLKNNHDK